MEKDSRLRSILKSLSWRLAATFITFFLIFTIFGTSHCEGVLGKTSLVVAFDLLIKLILYYGHERIWQMVPAGVLKNILRSYKS